MLKGVRLNVDQVGETMVNRTIPGEKLSSFEFAKGDPIIAAFATNQGIVVQNLQETGLLGLWRRGGWQLLGGVLARADTPAGPLELYGKLALRIEPYFGLPHRVAPKQQWSYEFFLVRRDRSTARGEVVRKWMFEPPQVLSGPYPSAHPVRADLSYDPISRRVRLSVDGLASPYRDEIEIPSGRR
jgi:hypothetical protein